MTPEMEMRITARNRTAQAFGEVRAELTRTGRTITEVERHTAAIGRAVGTLPAVFNAAFAGISVTSFASSIIEANRAVAELGRQARTSNVDVERFQELLAGVAEQRIDMASLANGLRELQDKGSEFAKDGGGRAAEALQAIGYSSEQVAEALKKPDQMFLQIIDRLGELDRASQIRYLGDIFGNAEGEKFLKLLEGGSEKINELGDAAVRNGDIIESELVGAAEEIEKKFDRMLRSWQVRFQSFAVGAGEFLSNPGSFVGIPVLGNFAMDELQRRAAAASSGLGADATGGGANWNLLQSMVGGGKTAAPPSAGGFDFRSFLDDYDSNSLEGGSWSRASAGIDKTTKSLKALDLGIDKTTPKVEKLSDVVSDELAEGFTGLFRTMREGGDVMDYVLGKAGSLADQLLNMGLQTGFRALLGGVMGGFGAPSFVGAGFGSYGSYEGGGSTGPGPRVGGLDGRGGRLALLHPNETVVDHENGGGTGVVMNFYLTGSRDDAAANARAIRHAVRGEMMRLKKNPDRT